MRPLPSLLFFSLRRCRVGRSLSSYLIFSSLFLGCGGPEEEAGRGVGGGRGAPWQVLHPLVARIAPPGIYREAGRQFLDEPCLMIRGVCRLPCASLYAHAWRAMPCCCCPAVRLRPLQYARLVVHRRLPCEGGSCWSIRRLSRIFGAAVSTKEHPLLPQLGRALPCMLRQTSKPCAIQYLKIKNENDRSL